MENIKIIKTNEKPAENPLQVLTEIYCKYFLKEQEEKKNNKDE